MKKKKNIFFLSLIFFGILCCAIWYWYATYYKDSLPYYSKGRYAKTKNEIKENAIHPISSFSFVNQFSDTINEKFISSSVVVMNYFFTRCNNICPIMTKNIKNIQETFKNKNDVKILSLSCDPKYDTPEKLKQYAKLYDVNPNQWFLLTGDKKILYHFARNELQISATEGNGDENDFIHSSYCVLIDKDQYIRGYYNATNTTSIEQLISDIEKLL